MSDSHNENKPIIELEDWDYDTDDLDEDIDADRYDTATDDNRVERHSSRNKKHQPRRETRAEAYRRNAMSNVLTPVSASKIMANAEELGTIEHLVGRLWAERELTILFSDTGVGKSLLGVQLAESIARGTEFPPFGVPSKPQRVIYLDFELTESQFIERYSQRDAEGKVIGKYPFSPDVLRSELIPVVGEDGGWSMIADQIAYSLGWWAEYEDSKVIIIDNITYLLNNPTVVGPALRLMKWLKDARDGYNFTILVIAHTPKRSATSPLMLNDLLGTRTLANFVDNVLALGTSTRGPNVRYLKQLKQRNAPIEYGSSNVVDLELCRMPGPAAEPGQPLTEELPLPSEPCFLGMRHTGFSNEVSHLVEPRNEDELETERNKLISKAKRIYLETQSTTEVARSLNISRATAWRYVKDLAGVKEGDAIEKLEGSEETAELDPASE